MGCTCRVMPLRIFVQGLSQVHKFESPSSLRFRPAPTANLYSHVVARQSRPFHASRFLNQDAPTGGSPTPLPEVTTDSGSNNKSTDEMPSVSQDSYEHAEPTANVEPAQAAEPHIAYESVETGQPAQPKPKPKHPKFNGRGNDEFRGKGRFNQDDKFKNRSWKPKSYKEERGDEKLWKAAGDAPRYAKPSKGFNPASEPFVGPAPGEPKEDIPQWKIQKQALKEKFPEGWKPMKRLSPDALAGIRALNAQFPDVYTTSTLAQRFEVSPENIRRILKGKWQPNADEEKERQERWFKRGMQVWDRQAALGMKPPRKWRLEGITRDPSYHAKRQRAIKINRELEEKDDREIRANLRRPKRGSTPQS